MRRIILSTFAASALLVACGGEDVDLNDIRDNFENPTGSVSDQSSVIAVNEKQTSAGGLESIAGATNPFGGFGLRARSVNEPLLARVNAQSLMQPHFEAAFRPISSGIATRAFAQIASDQFRNDPTFGSESDLSSCIDEEELQRQLYENVDASSQSASGSLSFEIDFDSCGQGVTGQIAIDGEFEISQTKLYIKMTERLTNVCETLSPARACVDGVLSLEMDGNVSEVSSIGIITGWNIATSWTEDGKAMSAEAKGGLRLSGDQAGNGEIEYLHFVNNAKGEEVSFVLSLSTANGGTLEIRGADGTLTCTVDAEGAGQCTGSFEHQWSKDDAVQVRNDPNFRFYNGG